MAGKKKVTKKNAKKRAWLAFSTYMRTLWNLESCKCYTCGKTLIYQTTQTGHWYPGHNDATFINEEFVRPQCKQCNYFKGGNYLEFQIRIIEEIGITTYQNLYQYAKSGTILTTSDYLSLQDFYKNELTKLTNNN